MRKPRIVNGQDVIGLLLVYAIIAVSLAVALLFLAGFVGATPVVKQCAQRISLTRAGGVLELLLMAGLLLVCTAYLVDGSFSPFLYFRF